MHSATMALLNIAVSFASSTTIAVIYDYCPISIKMKDPHICYHVPVLQAWWNVNGIYRSNRVPIFGVQRYRERLSVKQQALGHLEKWSYMFEGAHTFPVRGLGADSFIYPSLRKAQDQVLS